MRRFTAAALCVAGMGLLGGGNATAATGPVCNLIPDAGQDTTVAGLPTKAPDLDLLNTDLATNGTTLSVLFRVRNLNYAPDALTTQGWRFYVQFNAGTAPTNYLGFVDKALLNNVYTFTGSFSDGVATTVVPLAYDGAANQMRLDIPLSLAPNLRAAVLHDISVHALGNHDPTQVEVDTATAAGVTYQGGTPSCLFP